MAIDEALIQQVTRTIVAHFHPRRIVLFGSHARGDAGPDSDLDLFIEMDTPLSPHQRAIAVDDLFGLRDWAMDVFVYTPDEVLRHTGQIGTMLYTVEHEGRTLYECADSAAIQGMARKS